MMRETKRAVDNVQWRKRQRGTRRDRGVLLRNGAGWGKWGEMPMSPVDQQEGMDDVNNIIPKKRETWTRPHGTWEGYDE